MKKRILIIRLGSLGDIILTSPVVKNLKIHFPDSTISYLCKERFRKAAELIDGIDDIIAVPDDASPAGYGRLMMNLDKRNFNIILDLHGNMRSWIARKILTSDQCVVYPKRRYERMVAVKRKIIPKAWPHTIDLYNDAVGQLGVKTHCVRPVLKIPPEAYDADTERFLSRNREYIVVAPGAAHPNKQWPAEKYAQVAGELHRTEDVGVVWAATGTGDDMPEHEGIHDNAILRLNNCPLGRLVRLMSSALLTVANDSGIAHASSAVGTPVIAVFGPTHPALGFAPKGMHDRVVEVDEFCRPCSLHGKKPCYRDKRYCFDRIETEEVSSAAQEIIDLRRSHSRAVFIDRDGTLIKDKNFLSDPKEIEFENGSIEALKALRGNGYKLVIVSNQSGVARGYFDIDTVEKVNGRVLELLAAQGVEVDAVYFCPHYLKGTEAKYAVSCDCRKPSPGMAETAAYQLGIDFRRSFVVGDKLDDVNLARVTGAKPILVRTGYGEDQREELQQNSLHSDTVVADNLRQAADQILSDSKND